MTKKKAPSPDRIIQASSEKRGNLKIRVASDAESSPSAQPLTPNEMAARRQRKHQRKIAGSVGAGMLRVADTSSGTGGNFYSPQLSTDFLEKPQNLRERRAWYRHFYYSNELVGAAIDLHSTIPLSKIRLLRPKCKNEELAEYSYDFFVGLCDRLQLFKRLQEISHEHWLMGSAAVLSEENNPYPDGVDSEEGQVKQYQGRQRSKMLMEKFKIVDKDPNYLGWDKITILPPDQVKISKVMFSDQPLVEYLPDPQTKEAILRDYNEGPYSEISEASRPQIPDRIRHAVADGGSIPLDTDPHSGTHVCMLTRKKSQYEVQGVSILERCIETLLIRDKLRQAQTSIASRHMTPIRLVWAEDMSNQDTESLREQVDFALMDPDYSIVTNFEVHWEEMGSQGRLLDLSSEYEHQESNLYTGLGVTKELLTGEGMYGGTKISLEVLNIQYMQFREMIIDWIENNLFKPVARKKGFVETDKYGNEHLIYPKVSFTRLSIRDAGETFDQVFQLYNKGSVPIDVILEMLNIDPEIAGKRLTADLMTVNDSSFNAFLSAAYGAAGNDFAGKTNLIQKLAGVMGLDYVEQAAEGEAPPAGGMRFASVPEAVAPAVSAAPLPKAKNPDLQKVLDDPEARDALAAVLKDAAENPDLLKKLAAAIAVHRKRSQAS